MQWRGVTSAPFPGYLLIGRTPRTTQVTLTSARAATHRPVRRDPLRRQRHEVQVQGQVPVDRFTEEARRTYSNPIEQQALFVQKFGPSLTGLKPGGWLTFTPHPQLPDFPMIRYDVISKEHYARTCDLVFESEPFPA